MSVSENSCIKVSILRRKAAILSDTFTLTAVEAAHIQSYIFNSNRLKENIGASYLVGMATGHWAYATVRSITTQHNLLTNDALNGDRQLEKDSKLEAEVIYAGGGNFVCLFRTPDLARNFARQLTSKVLFEAPGLHLVLHSMEYRWTNEPLSTAVGRLLRELKAQRSYQPQAMALAGLGVTAMCNSTSMPAVTMELEDGEQQIYSAEVVAKHAFASDANEELSRLLQLDWHFRYPFDLDNLGRTEGEKSFLAVVHVDGNGLGRIVSSIAKEYGTIKQNRDYIKALRSFSERVKSASNTAMQMTMRTLQDAFDANGVMRWHFNGQAPLKLKPKDNESFWFPFRPLIFGGDDVTFICDGRIGIALALEFVRQFELATKAEKLGDGLTACAGIAIVKAHYPFARAYELSEQLCQSAKQWAREISREHFGETSSFTPSALDWHFTTGGLYADLETMRKREYVAPKGQISLTLRPVLCTEGFHVYRNWNVIERAVTAFQTGKWSGSRSKAKAFASVVRQGSEATSAYEARYLRAERLRLPDLPGFMEGAGWYDGYCGYFDALELMDLYIPLGSAQEVIDG